VTSHPCSIWASRVPPVCPPALPLPSLATKYYRYHTRLFSPRCRGANPHLPPLPRTFLADFRKSIPSPLVFSAKKRFPIFIPFSFGSFVFYCTALKTLDVEACSHGTPFFNFSRFIFSHCSPVMSGFVKYFPFFCVLGCSLAYPGSLTCITFSSVFSMSSVSTSLTVCFVSHSNSEASRPIGDRRSWLSYSSSCMNLIFL